MPSVAFSRDGSQLVATCGKAVCVIDTATGDVVYKANVDRFGAASAVFAPDGTIVSVGTASMIEVRDPSKKAKWAVRQFATKSKVHTLALGSDGNTLLCGGDGPLEVWDLAAGTCTATLCGLKQGVDAVALSRDGTRAAAGGLDYTAFVWELV